MNIFDIVVLWIRIAFPFFVLFIAHALRHQHDEWDSEGWDEPVKVHEIIHIVLISIIFVPFLLIIFGAIIYLIYFY